jgi:hypothetical protein
MKRLLLSLFVLTAIALPALAQAATINIQGTVTDSSGATSTFGPITVTTDSVAITSAAVTPAVAPAGTTRTLTVVANSSGGLSLTATVNAISGITFTPVAGQPLGTFVWTFVY